jgi:large subunit ribosomal protein L25
VNGTTYETLIKEIQFNPVSDRIEHIDFLELTPGKKIVAEVPLKLTGQSEGVKAGGKLIQKMRKLKIKATPENLKEAIEVSIDTLALGKSLYIRDIKEEGIEIVNTPEIPIASIEITRSLKSAEAEAKKAEGAKKK